MKAIKIDSKDNVAVVLGKVSAGDEISWVSDNKRFVVKATESIPTYHKIATQNISAGEPIIKYGEHIGIASEIILAGAHVHVHNVRNNREAL